MQCCEKPYWVIETGTAICRHCGATKAVAAPSGVSVTPWIPWPSPQPQPSIQPFVPYIPNTTPWHETTCGTYTMKQADLNLCSGGLAFA